MNTCLSRACFNEQTAQVTTTPHNHDPDEVAVELLHLKNELKAQAVTDHRAPRVIFDDVCVRFPRAALRIGYPGVRSTIYKYRQRGNPPIPRSLQEFSTILLGDQWRHLSMTIEGGDEPLFRGVVGGEAEGWTAAIYVSPRLRTALVNTQRLHIDGTFKVLPEQLHAYQLVTIHGEFLNHLFPVAFVLMTRKTQDSYQGVFVFLKQLIPDWNPQVILTDFELAMSNAAQLVWPNARVVGCFFHFAQAIYRMHRQLRLQHIVDTNVQAAKTLQMLMSLALLPAERIALGLRVITHYAVLHGLAARFRILLRYMENFWMRMVGANRFSVFGEPHRTNNALEAFHSSLLRTMGPHPGVWKYHDNLRKIENAQWQDYNRMANGVQHVRQRRRAYVRQDAAIHQASTMLIQGRYNEAQFLNRVSHFTLSLADTMRAERVRLAAIPGNDGRRVAAAEPVMPPPLLQAEQNRRPAPEIQPRADLPAGDRELPPPAAVVVPPPPPPAA
ncbi:uncharacterized protein LOC124371996, partial [Homalodisca vitripennis]|uniref:uncharacterized protein LOC124371996 n=1 Tax=Homalodisca vitripennis TaxID=197043 RepID=UPI001EECCB26